MVEEKREGGGIRPPPGKIGLRSKKAQRQIVLSLFLIFDKKHISVRKHDKCLLKIDFYTDLLKRPPAEPQHTLHEKRDI